MTALLLIPAVVFAGLLIRDCLAERRRRSRRATATRSRVWEGSRPARHAAHRSGIATPSRSPGANSDERQARAKLRTGSANVLPLGAESVPQRIRDRYRETS